MIDIANNKYLIDCKLFVHRSQIKNILEKEKDNLNRIKRFIEAPNSLCKDDNELNNEICIIRNEYQSLIEKIEMISLYLQNKISEVSNVK